MSNIVNEEVKLIAVDCFCGAGGESEGLEQAVNENGNRIAVVVIGINHDAIAIASHAANHPETHHYIEDFRALDPWKLISILHEAKRKYPQTRNFISQIVTKT